MTGRARGKRLRHRSDKMRAVYVDRRPFVEQFLESRPWCERLCGRRSVDVHELLPRGRGGSILDEENCVALCRECHDEIGQNPAAAEADGWLRRTEAAKCPTCGARLVDLTGAAGWLCYVCELVWAYAELAAVAAELDGART